MTTQGDKPTVLLAEDNPDDQYITRKLLEECGCKVIEAENGIEAVELALRERPDMIMLDLRMPMLDGYEAARRIRKERAMKDAPMIAYTAYYSYSLTENALHAGFDEYLVKPVTVEDMQRIVDRYLKAK